jgi:hypothetical protein
VMDYPTYGERSRKGKQGRVTSFDAWSIPPKKRDSHNFVRESKCFQMGGLPRAPDILR